MMMQRTCFKRDMAFRDHLAAWPKIPYRDIIAFRRFADFLRQCQTAMQSMNSLNILNDDRENRKILAKLPDYLVTRWGGTVANWKQQGRGFPPFCEFQSFVGIKADIACDPITSFQSLKVESSKSSRNFTGSKVASSTFTTDGREMNKGTPSLDKCLLCTKGHNLENCFQFFSMSLQERKDYIRENNLCFACLSYGHKSFVCKRGKTCKICSRKHPTPLHGDVRSLSDSTSESKATHNTNSDVIESDTEVKATSVNTKTCLFNKTNSSEQCSLIVPVWISSKDEPGKEVLTYAMLDTQSDTSFILESTLENLGVEGSETRLSLSTMLANNKVINSQRVNGLQVRGYNCDEVITLPSVFSRHIIPANRDHIPTPYTAMRWEHLQCISQDLMPLGDCEVSLLIGYDCPQALAPLEVILYKW